MTVFHAEREMGRWIMYSILRTDAHAAVAPMGPALQDLRARDAMRFHVRCARPGGFDPEDASMKMSRPTCSMMGGGERGCSCARFGDDE